MKNETKKVIRKTSVLLFGVYVILLVYFLFFWEDYGRAMQAERAYRYNLKPFLEIQRFWNNRELLGDFAFFANIFGNIMGFVPYGMMLPIIASKMNQGFLIVLSGFTLSLCVEVIQLFTRVGSFDVDDLILNTIGVVLGYIGFCILNTIRRRYYGKKI